MESSLSYYFAVVTSSDSILKALEILAKSRNNQVLQFCLQVYCHIRCRFIFGKVTPDSSPQKDKTSRPFRGVLVLQSILYFNDKGQLLAAESQLLSHFLTAVTLSLLTMISVSG